MDDDAKSSDQLKSGWPDYVFLQFMNPEISSLYQVANNWQPKQLYQEWVRLTKYAAVIGTKGIVIPTSYFFEVPQIHNFLNDLKLLRAAGLVKRVSSTPALSEYAIGKKHEYRDELPLFQKYEENVEWEVADTTGNHLVWVPRSGSSSADISAAWRRELISGRGVWQEPLEDRKNRRQLVLPSAIETAIYMAPDKLEGRAFIYRFVEPFLPFDPDPSFETRLKMLISRTYLASYLDELSAAILIDTPLGDLDCKLPAYSQSGMIRTISWRILAQMFEILGIRNYFESRLSWSDIIRLRAHPVLHWALNFAIDATGSQYVEFESLIRLSEFKADHSTLWTGRRAYSVVSDRLWQFHASVQPFLMDAKGGAMEIVRRSRKTTQRRSQMTLLRDHLDLGLLIALPDEFRELKRQFGTGLKPFQDEQTKTTYYFFDLSSDDPERPYSCVAVFAGGMGTAKASLLTQKLLLRWHVTTIVNVGIAASLDKDVLLGDVVAVSLADNYMERVKAVDALTADGGFEFVVAGEPFRSAADLVRKAENFEFAHPDIYETSRAACGDRLKEMLDVRIYEDLLERNVGRDMPLLHVGHIASGPIVGDSPRFVSWLRGQRDRTYLALEMESGSVLWAVYEAASRTGGIAIRGISDFGDGRKKEFDAIGKGKLREYAMHNALVVLRGLAKSGAFPIENIDGNM
jgi:nucleoside phosphorylase